MYIFDKGIAMQSDSNEQERAVLYVLLPILVLVIGGVVGLGVFKANGATDGVSVLTNSAVVTAPDNADIVELSANDASVIVDGGAVKFYFATGSAELASGAGAALGDAVSAAKSGKFVVLSGFHDETGDPAFNAELAKRRAMAVRASLLMAGAPEDRLVMRKPEVLTGSGSNAQARRVEVVISDNTVQ
jgi:outer membrane protein OmpA-like peptidoglycan-associated protein